MDAEDMLYRGKLIKLSNELTKGDLDNMKFLSAGKIPAGKLESITTMTEFFKVLQELDLLDRDNYEFLTFLLTNIKKPSLLRILSKATECEGDSTDGHPDSVDVFGAACHITATFIGRDWKKLARYLDLEESDIEDIEDRQRGSSERAHLVLSTWKKRQRKMPQVEDLTKILEKIPRHDILREIKKEKGKYESMTN